MRARTALVLKETADMKSSEVAFRRIGSDEELLSPENSDRPAPWTDTQGHHKTIRNVLDHSLA